MRTLLIAISMSASLTGVSAQSGQAASASSPSASFQSSRWKPRRYCLRKGDRSSLGANHAQPLRRDNRRFFHDQRLVEEHA